MPEVPVRDSLAVLAGVLGVMGFVVYIASMFRRVNPTRPSRSSWTTWAILNLEILAGMLKSGTATLQMAGITLGSLFAAVFSLLYGKKSAWSPLEKFVMLGCVLGLCFMIYNPTWGIAVSVLVGPVCGCVPGLVEAWKNPNKENKLSWATWATSSLISVILLPSWSIENAAQPVSFLANQVAMLVVIFTSPHRRQQ